MPFHQLFPNRFGLTLGAPIDAGDVGDPDTPLERRELDRPPYPYCPNCHDPWDEHKDGRCHVPGCKCGMNPW